MFVVGSSKNGRFVVVMYGFGMICPGIVWFVSIWHEKVSKGIIMYDLAQFCIE